MSKLKIYCDNGYIDQLLIAQAVEKVLKQKIKIYAELSFVSKKEIQVLNKESRKVDQVTDVLSFPMLDGIRGKILKKKDCLLDYDQDEKAVFIGSIVICVERAKEQAEEYGHSLSRELSYLTVHGMLHLFGYDHMTDEDKKEMRDLEKEIRFILRGVKE